MLQSLLGFLLDTTLDLSFAEYLQLLEYDIFQKKKNDALFYKYLDDKKIAFLDDYKNIQLMKKNLNLCIIKLKKLQRKIVQ